MRQAFGLIDSLEQRRLYSAGPVGHRPPPTGSGDTTETHQPLKNPPPAHGGGEDAAPRVGPRGARGPAGGDVAEETSTVIIADLEAVRVAKRALRAELESQRTTLSADRKAIRAAVAALSDELAPLQEKLKAELKAVRPTLREDYKAVRAVYAEFADELKADRKAIRAAGDDAAARAAAKAAYQETLDALNAALVAPKAKIEATLAPVTTARKAIQDLLDADPTYAAAKAKFEADKAAAEAAIKPLREAVKAAIEKLQADREAEHEAAENSDAV